MLTIFYSFILLFSIVGLQPVLAGLQQIPNETVSSHLTGINKEKGLRNVPIPCQFSASSTYEDDQMALEDLYYSLGGTIWVINDGWMKGDPCKDNWYGVCCSDTGRVTELRLPSNLIVGRLTDKIAELSELEALVLPNNSIEGPLPPQLFTMDKLKILDLSSNKFSAAIPEKISLPQLTNLTLVGNSLQGYLPSVWNTPNLKYLLLSGNSFQGKLPPSLGTVTKLIHMDISSNILSGVTGELGKLKSLEKLSLFSNRFVETTIPDEWSEMSSLKEIRIDGMYGSLPEWIGEGWSDIVSLSITSGQVSGTLPTSLCKFKRINFLDLSGNQITGRLPECLCDLSAKTLTTLRINGNQLSGNIPDCFERLHNLTSLSLIGNKFTGYLPRSLGSMPNIQSIDLSGNNLYGKIPTEYAKLGSNPKLYFDISDNKINSIEDNLEPFFKVFQNTVANCFMYGNPWTCPLPDYVRICNMECSKCNTPDKHASCTACISDSQCGWCEEGGNCLPGSTTGPKPYSYTCNNDSWIYEFQALCRN